MEARSYGYGEQASDACEAAMTLLASSSKSLPLPLDNALPSDTELSGRSLRRSMTLVSLAWFFGSIWFTATSGAPFTIAAQKLGASKFQFGLLAAIPFLVSLINLPASLLIEHTGQRKKIFFIGLYIQRLMWIPLALLPLWLVSHFGPSIHRTALTLFIVMFAIMHSGQAFGGSGWTSWMADIIPDRIRGRYFTVRRQWGIVSAIFTAFLVGWILDSNKSLDDFGMLRLCCLIFLVSSLFGTLDIFLFHWVPESPRPPQRGDTLLHAMRRPLHDRQFLWFSCFYGTLVFAVSAMGQFLTLYMIEKLQMKNIGVQVMLLSVPGLAQWLMLPTWGRAIDRMGKKPVLVLSALGLVPVGFGWCFMREGWLWMGYFLSAAGAALIAGVETANQNLVLEMSASGDEDDQHRGSTAYVAVNAVIFNIAGCLGGLTYGLIAQSLRNWHWRTFTFFEVLFALSALLRLLAVLIFLPKIKEKSARPTTATLRYVTTNFYTSISNTLTQPLKLLKDAGN